MYSKIKTRQKNVPEFPNPVLTTQAETFIFICKLWIISTVRPTMVEILSKPATLSSERYVTLTCVSEGSRPPAQLTWYKDNRKFKRGKVSIVRWLAIFFSIFILPSFILSKPATVSLELYVSLTWVSEGSRPPAQLTWYKNNRKLKRGKFVRWPLFFFFLWRHFHVFSIHTWN